MVEWQREGGDFSMLKTFLRHKPNRLLLRQISYTPFKPIRTMSSESIAKSQEIDQIAQGVDGVTLSKSALKKLEKEKQKEARRLEVQERLQKEKLQRENAPDYSLDRYGKLPMNQSQTITSTKRWNIKDIDSTVENKSITLRGRVQVSRPTGIKVSKTRLQNSLCYSSSANSYHPVYSHLGRNVGQQADVEVCNRNYP
jgi:hypothetical protein